MWVFQSIHLEGLLRRVDMTTMAASVEARVPFVDHKLVEFLSSMPFHYKIRWKSLLHEAMAGVSNSDEISERYDTTKYILRKAFMDDLPKTILERKKVGFPVPLSQWFGNEHRAHLHEILLDPSFSRWGLINKPELEKWLGNEDNNQDPRHGIKNWMLMNLALWLQSRFS